MTLPFFFLEMFFIFFLTLVSFSQPFRYSIPPGTKGPCTFSMDRMNCVYRKKFTHCKVFNLETFTLRRFNGTFQENEYFVKEIISANSSETSVVSSYLDFLIDKDDKLVIFTSLSYKVDTVSINFDYDKFPERHDLLRLFDRLESDDNSNLFAFYNFDNPTIYKFKPYNHGYKVDS